MKYVSWMKMSTGVAAMKIPLKPPIVNSATNAIPFSIGVWSWMLPRHMVPSQLNTLMADGMAIAIVEIMNVIPSVGFIPLMNMWCPQTSQPRKAMAHIANTIEW